MGHVRPVIFGRPGGARLGGPYCWDLCFSTSAGHGRTIDEEWERHAQPQQLAPAALAAAVALFSAAAVPRSSWSQCDSPGTCRRCVLAPFGALRRAPLAAGFSFGLYVLLVPFDNLLNTGSFGTVTKLLGIVAGAFLMMWILARRNVLPYRARRRFLARSASGCWRARSGPSTRGSALPMMPTYGGLLLLYAVVSMIPISPAQFRLLCSLVVAGSRLRGGLRRQHVLPRPDFAQESPARLIIEIGSDEIDPNHFSDALIFPAAISACGACGPAAAGAAGLHRGLGGAGGRDSAERLARRRDRAAADRGYYLCARGTGLNWQASESRCWRSTVQTSVFVRFSTALETGGSGRTSIWAVALGGRKAPAASGLWDRKLPDGLQSLLPDDAPAVSVRLGQSGAQPPVALPRRDWA